MFLSKSIWMFELGSLFRYQVTFEWRRTLEGDVHRETANELLFE